LLFWGTGMGPLARGTTIVPASPPETHWAWNTTAGFTSCTVIAGWEPGIVKSYPAIRTSPGLTLRSPSMAWGPMLMGSARTEDGERKPAASATTSRASLPRRAIVDLQSFAGSAEDAGGRERP